MQEPRDGKGSIEILMPCQLHPGECPCGISLLDVCVILTLLLEEG